MENDRRQISFIKPRRTGDGAIATIDGRVNNDNYVSFLSMLPQLPEGHESGKSFDANAKEAVKLNETDIGEILAVLTGRIEGVGAKNDNGTFKGLYHNSPNGNDSSIINFFKPTTGHSAFILGISLKRSDQTIRMSIGLTHGEAEQLRVFLENILSNFYVNRYTRSGGDGPPI